MTLLPKLLYLFRTLPVAIPNFALRSMQNSVMSFIWRDKRPRVARKTLYCHRRQGGLGVPDLKKYYQAAQIASIAALHIQLDPPLWTLLEIPYVHPCSLSSIPWLTPIHRPSLLSPILTHTLRIWDSTKYTAALISPHLHLTTLMGNPMFPPAMDTTHRYVLNWQRDLHHTRPSEEWGSIWNAISRCSRNITTQEAAYKITFKVKITARKCLPNQSFLIRPLGFTDKVEVSITTACDCDCRDEAEPGACNAQGNIVCGICSCNKDHVGKSCECVTGGKTNQELEQSCRKDNSSAVCSGAGECICGQCTCNPNEPPKKIYGQYCQCDNWNCEMFNNMVCGGQGICNCGNCICNNGYEGSACQCLKSTKNCKNTRGSICSGRGRCECNKCICKEGYILPFCETCPGCPSQCPRFGPCVECYIKQGEQSSRNCTHACPSVTAEKVDQLTEETFCREKDSENCWMQYALRENDGEDQYTIKYTLKRECPEAPNVYAIVGGTFGGVLLIGVICLLIWKCITYITDRKEYERFEKEKQKAKWNKNINPIFSTATTTVQNPQFHGEE
ncbi:PREDICTED: integrin beta-2-like [Nanorana parkeri]|uniref:integrin beta-2-like n=1 Tax=Nanorana parkeri TaxID=125878 RepID=UPI000854831D|nr:PREDICTED: integrin beta-2-like [Nanorana parkeri]